MHLDGPLAFEILDAGIAKVESSIDHVKSAFAGGPGTSFITRGRFLRHATVRFHHDISSGPRARIEFAGGSII